MSRHTQGTWHYEEHHDGPDTAIGGPIAEVGGDATGEAVGFTVGVYLDFGPHGNAETEANARLIAAAPDLLAACKLILPRMRLALAMRITMTGITTGAIADEVNVVEAAVAKAEGATPEKPT